MLRISFIIVALLFSNNTIGEIYYGYLGSCDDGVFHFDYKNNTYTAYLQHRAKNNPWQYQIIQKELKMGNNSSYIIDSNGSDPLIFTVTTDSSILHGKSIKNGYDFFYRACDEKTAINIIRNAKSYVKKRLKMYNETRGLVN